MVNYFTKDNKTLKKKIYDQSASLLGDDHLIVDPVYVIQMLKVKLVEVQNMIKNI